MTEEHATKQPEKSGFSTASLVLGILAILTSLAWYVSIVFGILAITFGALSLKSVGRKKSIAGIVTGIIGIILSILFVAIIFAAVPALRKNQQNTARRNDVSVLVSDIIAYRSENQGRLPAAENLPISRLIQITSVVNEGSPTSERAVYLIGESCDGTKTERGYSISVLLEDGSVYCQDS